MVVETRSDVSPRFLRSTDNSSVALNRTSAGHIFHTLIDDVSLANTLSLVDTASLTDTVGNHVQHNHTHPEPMLSLVFTHENLPYRSDSSRNSAQS